MKLTADIDQTKPLAYLVFEGHEYRVFPDLHEARNYAAETDGRIYPLYAGQPLEGE
jgi:hypothetical protein